MIECKICNREFSCPQALSMHLRYSHKDITKKEYFDLYLDINNDSKKVCPICKSKPLKYNDWYVGYRFTCDNKECMKKYGINRRANGIKYKYKNTDELYEKGYKICNTCNKTKLLDDFYNVKQLKGGKSHKCTSCTKKEYKEKCKDEEWVKNKRETKKIYNINNSEKGGTEYKKQWHKNKCLEDENYKVLRNIKNAHNRYIKRGSEKLSKSKKLTDIIDYSGLDFRNFMEQNENRIQKGFNYIDYLENRLTLDHIIPLSFFPLNKKGFKQANQLENLRLITKSLNCKKRDKIDLDLIKQFNLESLYYSILYSDFT